MSDKDFAGKGGFIWWTGVVENRDDPLKMGRCQVRCVGWDSDDKMRIGTDSLPWAMPMLGVNSITNSTPKEGDMAFGFFMDGESAQERVLMGVFPKIPLKAANGQEAFQDPRSDALATAPRPPESKVYNIDGTGVELTESGTASSYPINLDEPTTSRLARNDDDTITKTFIQERKDNLTKAVETAAGETWDEPETTYNTVYPFNNVIETESGHIFEMDDTFGAERIHLAHRNGSFMEMFPNGDKLQKITKDNYQIILGDDKIYVMGKVNITVQGDADVYVKKSASIKVDNNVEMTVGQNVTADVGGNIDATVGGSVTASVGGSVTASVGGSVTADVGGSVTATASSFTLNGPTTINGATNINGTLAVSGGMSGGGGATITGSVNASGDVTAGSVSLQGHTHTDTPGLGAGTTSPPN